MRTAECIVIFRGTAAERPSPVNKRAALWQFFIKRSHGLQSPLFSYLCIRRGSKFKSNFNGKCSRNCAPVQRTDGIVTTSSTPRHLANLCLYFKCAILSGGGWVSKLNSFFLPHLGFGALNFSPANLHSDTRTLFTFILATLWTSLTRRKLLRNQKQLTYKVNLQHNYIVFSYLLWRTSSSMVAIRRILQKFLESRRIVILSIKFDVCFRTFRSLAWSFRYINKSRKRQNIDFKFW